MKQIKAWIMQLSIRKKLVFYSYLIMAPILLLISVLLFVYNYDRTLKSEEETCIQNVQSLSDSLEALQSSVLDMGTHICVNYDINRILTSGQPEQLNKDALLWQHDAPMQIIHDTMAINGQIKTIAIYPENGVIPYLRCLDNSAYLADIEQVREQDIYQEAVSKKGEVLWQRVGKQPSDTYQRNRSEKIVMYREIYDLAKRNKLGYLVIGTSVDKFDEVCANALRSDREEIIVQSANGAELVRCGQMDGKTVSNILKEQEDSPKELLSGSVCLDYRVYRCVNKETDITVYKIVPRKITLH